MNVPTVKPAESFSADGDAAALRAAIHGVGKCKLYAEQQITHIYYLILLHLPIMSSYSSHLVILPHLISPHLALLLPSQGAKDPVAIINILAARSNAQRQDIKLKYKANFGKVRENCLHTSFSPPTEVKGLQDGEK